MSWSATHQQWQSLPDESSSNRSMLEFSEAMQTFQAMFPNLDDALIEEILRSHNGNVDRTIDSLLKMSTSEEAYYEDSNMTARSSNFGKRHENLEDISDSLIPAAGTYGLAIGSRWKPAMLRPLPKDFLIISNSVEDTKINQRMLSNINSDTLSQKLRDNEELRANATTAGMDDGDLHAFLEDERLAIMLQNEEFVKMISQDDEFMEAVNREQLSTMQSPTKIGSSLPLDHPHYHESRQEELNRLPDVGSFPYTATVSRSSAPSGSSGSRRLGPHITSNMTKNTKVKLAKLAKKFFTKKGFSGKKATGLPITNSSKGALSSAGQAPLLDDDELANSANGSYHLNSSSNNYGRL